MNAPSLPREAVQELVALLRSPNAAGHEDQLKNVIHSIEQAEPLDAYKTLVSALLVWVEEPALQSSKVSLFQSLLAQLPDSFTNLPLVEDANAYASLLEPLLLAAGALGVKPTGELQTSAKAARALGTKAPLRLGHAVVKRDVDGGEAEILPVLASSLLPDAGNGQRTPRDLATHLTWDQALQEAAAKGARSDELARLALGSPARWLGRYPEALQSLGSSRTDGETRAVDDSPERLLRAAGVTSTDANRAIPGMKQRPASKSELSLEELLDRLETSPTAWQWSDAIAELLARDPNGMIAGVEIDMRRLAAAHIASFFHGKAEQTRRVPERGVRRQDWQSLEIATLKHGAVLAERTIPAGQTEQRVRAAWLFGDWIGRVLRESPFWGADPELLAARVEAALPAQVPACDHPLWPTTMGTTNGSLRFDELWMMHALLRARTSWKPPGAVLDALRGCANRLLNQDEQRVEEAFARSVDPFEWPGPHFAPPLVARWLLYFYQTDWLTSLKPEVQDETFAWLERFFEAPTQAERGAWIMLTLFRDASKLNRLRQQSLSLWMRVAPTLRSMPADMQSGLAAPFCLWGATLASDLPADAAAQLLTLAAQTPPRWRPSVLFTLGSRGEPNTSETTAGARQRLLELIDGADVSLRLPSAIAVTQLARTLQASEREALLDAAIGRMSTDLRAQPSLRVELMRVGRNP